MIDIESELFTKVATALREKYSTIYVTGEYVKSPPSFPCVSLVEVDNAVYRKTLTQEGKENHSALMYELNVYSNKTKGKKSECREIASLVDDILSAHNFTRMMLEPIPNIDDATIYRMCGRYRALVDRNKTIYRR